MWCKSTIRPGIHNCLGKYFRNGWRLGGTDLSGLCLASNHLGSSLVGALKAWLRGVGAQNGPPFAWLRGVGVQNGPPFVPRRGARSKTGRLLYGYGVLGPKTGRLLHGYGVSGPKTGRLLHGYGVRGPKRAAFYTATGCAVQNGPPFSCRQPARRKRRAVFHSSWVRGENGGLFFTVLGCAVKTADCFSQFLPARRKRRPVFHSSCLRGENGGGASRRRKVYPAVRSHVTTRGRASNIRGAALGESWKTMREPLRA